MAIYFLAGFYEIIRIFIAFYENSINQIVTNIIPNNVTPTSMKQGDYRHYRKMHQT